MKLEFTWINLLILFGALQGLIFGIILLFNKKHPGAKFLSVVMFTLAYNGIETFNWSAGLDKYNLFFAIFSFTFTFALGPGFYLYITSLLDPLQSVLSRTVFMHFGVVFFQLAVRLATVIYHILWINKIFATDVTPSMLDGWYRFYAEPLSVVLFLGYLVASINKFRKFKAAKHNKSISKDGQQLVYKWIQILLVCLTALGVAWALTILTPYFFNIKLGSHYYPIEIILVLFTYWIALTGYHQIKLIYRRNASKLQLTDALSEEYFQRLREAMEKGKLYRDPELNLNKLASHTGINTKTISTVLNQYQNISFNDFINDYRIREVKERIIDPSNRHLTISGIALEYGFNSQATFQRAFKSSTGMSPRQYISTHQKKTA